MAYPELSRIPVYDLQDFNDLRLTAAGELELRPDFEHPVSIRLGEDLLELSRVAVTVETTPRHQRDILFSLKNLSAPDESDIVIISGNQDTEPIMIKDIEHRARVGHSHVIGTETTPELGLSSSVDPQHLLIRIGSLAGYLHFSDLYSTNGTTVQLHADDMHFTGSPRRMGINRDGEFISEEAERGRWSRSE